MTGAPVTFDLDAEVVELAPYVPPMGAPAPLREVAFRRDAWLSTEIETLCSLFRADESITDIAAVLDRPFEGVRTKIWELGLRRNSTRPWSELEDLELARRYTDEPASRLAQDLGRTPAAVYARAGILGLTEGSPPYDEWENTQIREAYRLGTPVAQLAVLIGRTISGLTTHAHRTLNLRHANAIDGWSDDEMSLALSLASQGIRYSEIRTRLADAGHPLRSRQGFSLKIRALGYGRGWGRVWTPEEDDLLRKAYAEGGSLSPLRERLGREASSIAWRARHLNLRHPKPDGFRQGPVWTEEQTEALRALYGTMPVKQIAAQIGRDLRATYVKAHHLGLSQSRAFDADEDLAIRTAWAKGISLTDLSEALDRDPTVVSKRAQKLGVSFSSAERPKAPRTRRASRPPTTLASILAMQGQEAAQ